MGNREPLWQLVENQEPDFISTYGRHTGKNEISMGI